MTKTEWATLNGKQQWDVQVALRGPDCQHSEPIKWLTTSVIRWAMHTVMRVGGTLNDDLKCVVVPSDTHILDRELRQERSRDQLVLCWSPQHFFNHVVEAAQVCGLPYYIIPNDTYLPAVAETHPQYTLLRLWAWAKDEPRSIKLYTELNRHLTEHFHVDPAVHYKRLKEAIK